MDKSCRYTSAYPSVMKKLEGGEDGSGIGVEASADMLDQPLMARKPIG